VLLRSPALLTFANGCPCNRLRMIHQPERGARLALAITLDWLRANGAVQRVRLHQHSMPGRVLPSVRPSDRILWRKA
jgi:hypothetical protein